MIIEEEEEEVDEELQQALLLSMQQPTNDSVMEEKKPEVEEGGEKKEGDKPSHEDLMVMLELSVNEEMLKELISIDVSKLRALKARKNLKEKKKIF